MLLYQIIRWAHLISSFNGSEAGTLLVITQISRDASLAYDKIITLVTNHHHVLPNSLEKSQELQITLETGLAIFPLKEMMGKIFKRFFTLYSLG